MLLRLLERLDIPAIAPFVGSKVALLIVSITLCCCFFSFPCAFLVSSCISFFVKSMNSCCGSNKIFALSPLNNSLTAMSTKSLNVRLDICSGVRFCMPNLAPIRFHTSLIHVLIRANSAKLRFTDSPLSPIAIAIASLIRAVSLNPL